jgi:RHS repeat-associated protein
MTANGSPGQVTGFGYDEANRLSGVQLPGSPGNGSMAEYSYDAANQRIYASITTTVNSVQTTNNYIYFYGADGKKLGVWQLTTPSNIDVLTLVSMNLWFGGRLLKGEDRLQSVGKYFPYGEDRYNPTPANPSNDQEKFATYTRDSISGLDYAVNRYYAAGMGRFMSPDPYRGSASPRSPQTWNRYPFTPGDPVNYNDAKGLTPTCASTGADCCDPDIDPWCDPCDPGDPGGEHTFGLRFVSSFGGNDEPCEPDPGPQLPDCTIGLFQRGVPFPGSPAVHTYLVLTETEPDGEIDIDDVLEGGPQNPHSPIFNPRMLWGNLIGYIEAVPQNPIGIVKGKFGKKGTFLGSTNPYTNERIGFEVGPDTCSELSSLLDVVNNYDATAGVLYAPIPNGGTTYNSNSFTYSLLYDIGLAGILSPTAWAPSWGQLVPGLNW